MQQPIVWQKCAIIVIDKLNRTYRRWYYNESEVVVVYTVYWLLTIIRAGYLLLLLISSQRKLSIFTVDADYTSPLSSLLSHDPKLVCSTGEKRYYSSFITLCHAVYLKLPTLTARCCNIVAVKLHLSACVSRGLITTACQTQTFLFFVLSILLEMGKGKDLFEQG